MTPRISLTLLLLSLGACGESPTPGAPGAPTAPPVDNEICRRVFEADARTFAGGGRGWTFAGVGFPQPVYTKRLTNAAVDIGFHRHDKLADVDRLPHQALRLIGADVSRVNFEWSLRFSQPYAGLQVGQVVRMGEGVELTNVNLFIDAIDPSARPADVPARTVPVPGTLTLTVFAHPRASAVAYPVFRLDGVLCERNGAWAGAFHEIYLAPVELAGQWTP